MSAAEAAPAEGAGGDTRQPLKRIERPPAPVAREAPAGSSPAGRLIAGRRTGVVPASPSVTSSPAASEGRAPVEKVTFQMPAELRAQSRSAFHYTQAVEQGTWSEFLSRAVSDRIAALSAQYNDGQPWTPMTTHLLPGPRP